MGWSKEKQEHHNSVVYCIGGTQETSFLLFPHTHSSLKFYSFQSRDCLAFQQEPDSGGEEGEKGGEGWQNVSIYIHIVPIGVGLGLALSTKLFFSPWHCLLLHSPSSPSGSFILFFYLGLNLVVSQTLLAPFFLESIYESSNSAFYQPCFLKEADNLQQKLNTGSIARQYESDTCP